VVQVTGFLHMISERPRTWFLGLAVLGLLIATAGCGNSPSAAQKLFDKGEYQKVIDRYPDLEIARRAHAKIADSLYQSKQYAVVLSKFSDTPAAFKSKMAMAQMLFDAGRYQAVLDSFPNSPLVPQAKDKLADSVYATGDQDKVLALYPESQKAKLIKEQRSVEAMAKTKKLRGDALKNALQDIQKQYPGTSGSAAATEQFNKLNQAQIAKIKSKKQ
jgi:hypothetical protein